jgi:hypothetical protein
MSPAWEEASRRYWEQLGPREEYVRKVRREWNRQRRAEMSLLWRLVDPLSVVIFRSQYRSDFIAYLCASYPPMTYPPMTLASEITEIPLPVKKRVGSIHGEKNPFSEPEI